MAWRSSFPLLPWTIDDSRAAELDGAMARPQKLLTTALHVAVAGLAVVCLVGAGAAQGGRFSPRLDVLANFAPIWAGGAVLALAYGAVVARGPFRLALVGLGLTGAAAGGLLILPEVMRPIRPAVPAQAPVQIKLIQFNVWEHNVDVDGTADWIAAQQPDVVLMEETEPPIRKAMIHRGFHYIRGVADSAIFSRQSPTFGPYRIPAGDWHSLPSFSRATFPSAAGPYSIIVTHLKWPTRAIQPGEMSALARLMDHYPGDRLILAGDFNLTPWTFALQRWDKRIGLERRDRAIYSWPARLVRRQPWPATFLPIDHLYAGRAWRTVSLTRGPCMGSDHYPLVAVLTLAKQDP
jgi:endonuclease/exonuclease/phosphatase (EEP) superfamily protein YafD